jgi:P2 family phage major capsid protein
MRNDTRLVFNAYMAAIATLSGVASAAEKFTVDPSVQQKLETHIQESSDFLKRVNIIGVDEQQGEKLGLGIGSPIASTTNTAVADRAPSDPTSLDKLGYYCTQTNFDTYLTYQKLDAWAKFKDFQTRIRDALVQRMALDRMAVGFNGTSRAATSDKVANPLLQDVNIGWLEKHRVNAPARVLDEIGSTGKIQIGDAMTAANGYKNLDALVYDIVNELIEPWYRNDTQLVAVVGRKLMSDKYFPLINKVQDNSEKIAADLIVSQKRIGGLTAVQVPFFPDDAIAVTRLDNLSIYFQNGARRRTVIDNAKRDRIENYESSNEAYVVEDHGCMALAENIEIVVA